MPLDHLHEHLIDCLLLFHHELLGLLLCKLLRQFLKLAVHIVLIDTGLDLTDRFLICLVPAPLLIGHFILLRDNVEVVKDYVFHVKLNLLKSLLSRVKQIRILGHIFFLK